MKVIYGLAAAAALISLATLASADVSTLNPERPDASTERFMLMLDGLKTGFVKSVDGGGIVGEVVAINMGGGKPAKKHVTTVKYEEFSTQVGLDMGKTVYDWVTQSWLGKPNHKDGAVVTCNAKYEAVSAKEFSRALLTETIFPAFDATSKNPALLTLKFQPEVIRSKKAAGNCDVGVPGKPKAWLASNFRLELKGVDTTKVSKIDSFSVKQRHDGTPEFSNLKVTFAESTAQSWIDWHEDFVVRGNNADANERNGAIVFLTPDFKNELGRVNLYNVGIFGLGDDATAGRMTAELYVERMEFKPVNR